MTRDDIVRLAREAGMVTGENLRFGEGFRYRSLGVPRNVTEASLIGFASLVIEDFLSRAGQYVTNDASRDAAIQAAALVERDACAKACESIEQPEDEDNFEAGVMYSIAAIRARNTA